MKTATAIATKSSGKNFFFPKDSLSSFLLLLSFFRYDELLLLYSCYLSFLCLSIRFVIPIFFWCSIRSFYASVQIYLMFFFVCVFLTPFLLCVCATNRKIYNSEKWLYWISIFFSLCVCVCNDPKKQKWLSYLCLSQSYY